MRKKNKISNEVIVFFVGNNVMAKRREGVQGWAWPVTSRAVSLGIGRGWA